MDRERGCPPTSLEPRTSDRALVLGKGFLGELDRVLVLGEGFLGELKLVLDLSEGFSRRARARARTCQVVLFPTALDSTVHKAGSKLPTYD